MKEKQCKYCGSYFTPVNVNSIYCREDCRKLAVKQRYYDNKKKFSSTRVCKKRKCKTILSRYNRDDICGSCQEKETVKKLKSWGWSESRINQRWFLD